MEEYHLNREALEAGFEEIKQSPGDEGPIALIVRRPAMDERELVEEAQLSLEEGLVGDNWKTRGALKTPPREASVEKQITLMNVRAVALIAQQKERWPLAGDQLYVDLDLSEDNLPPGTRLSLGSAIVERTAPPHTGCKKFTARFGLDAMKFVNSPEGRHYNLRGVNAKVIQPGSFSLNDRVKKLESPTP